MPKLRSYRNLQHQRSLQLSALMITAAQTLWAFLKGMSYTLPSRKRNGDVMLLLRKPWHNAMHRELQNELGITLWPPMRPWMMKIRCTSKPLI
jgi:hypothetical protein